jgi:hypothetical protein
VTAVRWVFQKHWHPERKRLACLRALWLILTGYETEICGRCGGRVGVVFHVPDELWARYSGFPGAARSPGGEAGVGVLCVPCIDELVSAGSGSFPRWACALDDSVMVG